MITRNVEVEIRLNGRDLAEEFWNLDSFQQSYFFNHLGKIGDKLPMQLQYITDDTTLKPEGREVMRMIGEYSGKE